MSHAERLTNCTRVSEWSSSFGFTSYCQHTHTHIYMLPYIYTIRHIIITRTFCIENYFQQKHAILSTKVHQHYSQIFFSNYFPLRVIAFFMRNLNLRIAHFGVTHPNLGGNYFRAELHTITITITQKYFFEFNKQSFCDKKYANESNNGRILHKYGLNNGTRPC